LLVIGVRHVLYLLPGQGTTTTTSADVVAQVGDQAITMTDVSQQLGRLTQMVRFRRRSSLCTFSKF